MAGLSGMSGTGSMNSRFDIANRYTDVNGEDYSAYVNRWEEEEKLKQLYEDKGTLDFQDMLNLMVAQFQNQTIDNQAEPGDMMNQLVQMSTMQAMNQMTSQMEELTLSNVMSYSRSLVDNYVTVGVWKDETVLNDDGTFSKVRKLEEIYDKVIGVGTYGGQQVIFLEKGGMFYLSDILAVGRLPEEKEEPEGDGGEIDPDAPVGPSENGGNPDIDDDGNPIDTPTPPVKDDGTVDDPDPNYNGENGTDTKGVG